MAKWSPATRSFVWVQRSGGNGHKVVTALAVSGSSVYVAGAFYSTAAFGTTTLVSAGINDAFVAKLTDAGTSATFTWAQRMGSTGSDYPYALAASGSAVYLAGRFVGTVAFGGATLTSTGVNDAFVTKLTDAGAGATVAWARAVGSSAGAMFNSMAVQGTSIYLLGIFGGTATLGSTSLTSVTTDDVFVAKLTDAGSSATFTWAQGLGGTTHLDPRCLAAQGNQVYLVGGVLGTVSFGSTSLTSTSLIGGHYNTFVAKLADAGPTASFVWARAVNGDMAEDAYAAAVQGNNIYIGGSFSGTASFDGTVLTFGGYAANTFVAKLIDAGSSATFAWAKSVSGFIFNGVATLSTTPTAVYVSGGFNDITLFDNLTLGSAGIRNVAFFATLPTATGLATTADFNTSAPLALFPTPTSAGTRATVQQPAGLAAGPATLTLLDGLGRVIRTTTVALAAGSAQTTFDVAGLVPGVYALRVAVGERRGTARLVVE